MSIINYLFVIVTFIITYTKINFNVTAFSVIPIRLVHSYCSQQPLFPIQSTILQATTTTMSDQSIQDPTFVTDDNNSNNEPVIRSLCGPLVIQSIVRRKDDPDNNKNRNTTDDHNELLQLQWTLTSIDDEDSTNSTTTTSAIHAWQVLQPNYDTMPVKTSSMSTEVQMIATWNPTLYHMQIDLLTSNDVVDDTKNHYTEMMTILSRVLIQYTLSTWYQQQQQEEQRLLFPRTHSHHHPHTNMTIQMGTETPSQIPLPTTIPTVTNALQDTHPNNSNNDENNEYALFVRTLFQGLSIDTSDSELVEMVFVTHNYLDGPSNTTRTRIVAENSNSVGVFGIVPRHWVHQLNLLHRGIGVLVTKDAPILAVPSPSSPTSLQQQPDIYCHQRTSTKRIFPSLYDMFIGGVSLVGESSVTTALREVSEELGITTIQPRHLTQRLFQCIVCTSYNRCVVDVFGYTINTTTDLIEWQKEEVAWGAFVPYNIVTAAAHLSIHRLQKDNKWPGCRFNLESVSSSQNSIVSNASISKNENELSMVGDDKWKTWDFVPDGLLVWESWIHEQRT